MCRTYVKIRMTEDKSIPWATAADWQSDNKTSMCSAICYSTDRKGCRCLFHTIITRDEIQTTDRRQRFSPVLLEQPDDDDTSVAARIYGFSVNNATHARARTPVCDNAVLCCCCHQESPNRFF